MVILIKKMCLKKSVFAYLCFCLCISECMFVCIYIIMCVCVCISECMFVCMHMYLTTHVLMNNRPHSWFLVSLRPLLWPDLCVRF